MQGAGAGQVLLPASALQHLKVMPGNSGGAALKGGNVTDGGSASAEGRSTAAADGGNATPDAAASGTDGPQL